MIKKNKRDEIREKTKIRNKNKCIKKVKKKINNNK